MSSAQDGTADSSPELFERAGERLLAAAPADRAQALEELVREHPRLEAELRRLAADLAGAERLLAAGFTSATSLPAIGAYRVLRSIGEGAFGIVYLCSQQSPVRREVAVKVLRHGIGDRRTLARFESERHLLASLRHDVIAQVLDAGVLPDGRPWFAMEYVAGRPITSYCDEHRLDVEPRVDLFVRLCHGVHHANSHGIVHRDLKPANVLVVQQDGGPELKIIDFGIAKAVHGTDGEAWPRTETGHVVGTPGYMSPEQARGGSAATDARADVFSLGVMLYELLTGELPWGPRPASLDSDPPSPSLRVVADTTGRVAHRRSMPPRRLASRLRGDLDWIVLKALRREPEGRYASAQELAADLLRHRRGEPVLAGPPTLGYRLRKLVRRHRTMSSAAGVLVVFGVLSSVVIQHYRSRAESSAADVEAAAANLLARANDPRIVNAPRSASLRQALVEDALALHERFAPDRAADPRLRERRARALWTLSQVHWLVGEYAESEKVAREAVAEAEALVELDPDDVRRRGVLGNALRNVGRAASSAGRVEAARAAFDRAVAELERCHAKEPRRYADLLVAALMEWSSARPPAEVAAGIAGLRRAVAIQEDTLRQDATPRARSDLLQVLMALVTGLSQHGEVSEAEAIFARAEQLLAGIEDDPGAICRTLTAGGLLAAERGDHELAIRRLTGAIAAADRWCEREPDLPPAWGDRFDLHGMLALQHRARGDRAAAEAELRTAIAVGEARVVRFPADVLAGGQLADVLSGFAVELLASGRRDRLDEAEAHARRAVALLEAVPSTVDAVMSMRARWIFLSRLGFVLDAAGRDDARSVWAETGAALATWRTQVGIADADAVDFVAASLRVARHELQDGATEQAATTLATVADVIAEHAAAGPDLAAQACEMHRLRALLAVRANDLDRAVEESDRAAAAGSGWSGAVAAGEALYAAWRAGAPVAERAITRQREAIEALRSAVAAAPDDVRTDLVLAQSRVRIAKLLAERGEDAAARALLGEAIPALERLHGIVQADDWDEDLASTARALVGR